MLAIETIRRFIEPKKEQDKLRTGGVVVLEIGGGYCNKAGKPSCPFCASPKRKIYDPTLDPSTEMVEEQFGNAALLKPTLVSIVPNGEAVLPDQQSNTPWNDILQFKEKGKLSKDQAKKLSARGGENNMMSCAEKMALIIALGKNQGLNLSLTTNGTFLDKDLITLYREMGLECLNLSYHPDKPFNPNIKDPELDELINRANEAIGVGIIPTITHVLTSKNADTFVALADYVTEHDIFFAVGIANTLGGGFSTKNKAIEPTDEQVKTVFRRLLARKLFADRHIRTTIPYLLMAPYLRHWVCDQTTDFFHISFDKTESGLKPRLNVCSDVRPKDIKGLDDFITENGFDTASYLEWRSDAKRYCPGCTSQCYFESEARGTLNVGHNVERWDWWDSFGKGFRQRYTFRHPIRPMVSKKEDFQNPYLWESFLQGSARIIAGLKDNHYWQQTIKRSGVNHQFLLDNCIDDVTNLNVISLLVQSEKQEAKAKTWHDCQV